MASVDVGDTLRASTSGFMISSPKLATLSESSSIGGSSSSSSGSGSDDDTAAMSRLLSSGSGGAVLRQNVAISTGKRNGSLHMVADKLKDKLSRQLEESKTSELDNKTDVDICHATGNESNTSSQETHRPVAMAASRSQYHSIQQLCKPSRHNDVMSNSSGDIASDNDDVMSNSVSPGSLHNNNNDNDNNGYKIDNDIIDDVGADSSPSTDAAAATNVDDVNHHVAWNTWSVTNCGADQESQLLKNSGEGNPTDDVTRSESASAIRPEVATGARRQRRKQYVPLQHQLDARQPASLKRPYIGAVDGEEQEEEEEEEEWRVAGAWLGESGRGVQSDMEADSEKLRQGLQRVSRECLSRSVRSDTTTVRLDADYINVALWQGLQRVQQRLAEMQLKYLRYFDDSVDSDDVIVDVSGDDDVTAAAAAAADDATKRDNEEASGGFASDINRNEIPHSDEMRSNQPPSGSSNNVDALARRLKAEISDSVGSLVDDIVRSFVERHFVSHRRQRQTQLSRGLQDRRSRSRSSDKEDELSSDETWQPRGSSETNGDVDVKTTSGYTASGGCSTMTTGGIQFPAPILPSPSVPLDCDSFRRAAARLVADQYALQSAAAVAAYLDSAVFQHSKTAFEIPPHHSSSTVPVGLALPLPTASSTPNSRLFNPAAYYPASAAALINHFQSQEPGSPFVKEPEQTEALPLIVGAPKKKRTKVTDTRLSPRAARALLQESLQQLHQQQQQQQQQQQSAFSHNISPREDVHSPGSLSSFYQPRQHHHHHHHHQRLQLSDHHQQQQQQHSPVHHPHHMASSPRHLHDAFPSNLFPSAAGSQMPRPQVFPPPPPTSLFQNAPCSPGHLSMHNASPASLAHHHWRAMYAAAAAANASAGSSRAISGGIRGQSTSLPVSASSFERRGSPIESHQQPEVVSEMNQLRQSMSRGSLLKTAECRGGSVFDQFSNDASNYDGMTGITSTLTPMHLRKAKLMFFYVRYPSSTILKDYFPDVRFNKNNTAQLVKWFSNFREFFYIQMEKYARQALSEGVNNVSELIVTTDSELYRVLVLHYNRNNQIDVPEGFRFVVQAALREFYLSIIAEKDQEQSWKKAIYKVIARLDEVVPEYFKFPNWLEQLADC